MPRKATRATTPYLQYATKSEADHLVATLQNVLRAHGGMLHHDMLFKIAGTQAKFCKAVSDCGGPKKYISLYPEHLEWVRGGTVVIAAPRLADEEHGIEPTDSIGRNWQPPWARPESVVVADKCVRIAHELPAVVAIAGPV